MEETLLESLTPKEIEFWSRYRYEERVGLRKQSLETLDAFARSVAASPERRDQFARQLCTLMVDHGVEIPLGFAVKTYILFPTLTKAFEQGSADAARWIGVLYTRLAGLPIWDAWLFDASSDYFHLTMMHEAYKRDPQNVVVQQMLVKVWWWDLDFSIHEMPRGVLYGMYGASLEQCLELHHDLAEFRTLTQKIGVYGTYHEWIDRCDRWYRWYIDYKRHRNVYSSFEQYAEMMGYRRE